MLGLTPPRHTPTLPIRDIVSKVSNAQIADICAHRLHPKPRDIAPSTATLGASVELVANESFGCAARAELSRLIGTACRGQFLCRHQVFHVNLLDLAVELERRLVVVVERHRRSERYSEGACDLERTRPIPRMLCEVGCAPGFTGIVTLSRKSASGLRGARIFMRPRRPRATCSSLRRGARGVIELI
jgi:hypothetical protein